MEKRDHRNVFMCQVEAFEQKEYIPVLPLAEDPDPPPASARSSQSSTGESSRASSKDARMQHREQWIGLGICWVAIGTT